MLDVMVTIPTISIQNLLWVLSTTKRTKRRVYKTSRSSKPSCLGSIRPTDGSPNMECVGIGAESKEERISIVGE